MPQLGQYETKLSPAEEAAFRQWKAKYAPQDSGADYDLRGAFKAGIEPDPATGHWPDTFKKPNHETFSVESQYAVGANRAKAGSWQGEVFTPAGKADPLDALIAAVPPEPDPLDALIAAVPAEGASVGDYAQQAIGSFARGGARFAASGLTGLFRIADSILPGDQPDPAQDPLVQGIRSFGQGLAPPVPGLEDSFLASDVPAGLGSAAAMVPAALLGGPGMAAAGALAGGNEGFESAQAAGATPGETAVATTVEGLLGAGEVFGVGGALGRLGKAGGGLVRRVGVESLGESVQEGFQDLGTQAVRKATYQPEAEINLGQTGRAMGVGAVVGGGTSIAVSGVNTSLASDEALDALIEAVPPATPEETTAPAAAAEETAISERAAPTANPLDQGGRTEPVNYAVSESGTEAAPRGKTVYHGSPHEFDRFSTQKIGTGEGAQTFGHGLYFTDTKEIGDHYREALSSSVTFKGAQVSRQGVPTEEARALPPEARDAIDEVEKARSVEAALRAMRERAEALKDSEYASGRARLAKSIGWLETNQQDLQRTQGRTYEANLVPADDEFLLWDRPLSEQSPRVRAALGVKVRDFAAEEALAARAQEQGIPLSEMPEYDALTKAMDEAHPFARETGEQYYRRLTGGAAGDAAAASRELRGLGIRGIKYLDENSRAQGDGTYNYVVFDDSDVLITKTHAPTPPPAPADTTSQTALPAAEVDAGAPSQADVTPEGTSVTPEVTPPSEPDLSDPRVREHLGRLAMEVGGKSGGQQIRNAEGTVIGRTRPEPNSSWWLSRPGNMSATEVSRLIERATSEKPGKFTARQQEMLDFLLHTQPDSASRAEPEVVDEVPFDIPEDEAGLPPVTADAWGFGLLGGSDFRPRAPDTSRAGATPDSLALPPETPLQLIERKVRDRLNRFRVAQKVVAEKGGAVPEEADVDLAASLMPGRAAERVARIERGPEKQVGQILQRAQISPEEAGEFLAARHAEDRRRVILERNPKLGPEETGAGMTRAEAAAVLSRVAQDPRRPHFERLARIVERVNRERLDALEEGGLLSSEGRAAWEKFGSTYVPLRTATDPEQGVGGGRSLNVKGKEAKRAEGRQSKADNPLVWTFVQAKEAVLRAEKNRVGTAVAKLVEANPDPLWEVTDKPKPEDAAKGYVLAFKENGRERYLVVRDERYAAAFKGVGVEDAPKFLRPVAFVMRQYGQLLTARNPEFWATNFVRDLSTAGIHISAEQGKAFSSAFRSPKKVGQALRTLWTLARDPDAKGAQYDRAREFAEEGGKAGWGTIESFETQLRKIEKATAVEAPGPKKAIKAADQFIRDLNEAVENAMRFHAYSVAREMGISKKRAAKIARELTVDFNRKGEWGPVLNSLYLFANANVQGSARVLTGVVKNRQIQKMTLGLAAAGYVLSWLNRVGGGEDDDGVPYWEKRSTWDKSKNLTFLIPGTEGKGVKVPLPWGYGLFYYMGSLAEEVVSGALSPTEAGLEVLVAARQNFDPLGGSTPLQAVAPTALRPFIEVEENKNHAGKPIMPAENPFDRTPPPDSERHFDSVSPNAKAFTDWLNRATGGDDQREGAISISPETIEHFSDFLSGGVGQFARRMVELPQRVQSGEWTLKDVPLVRRFASEPDESYEIREFYDVLAKIERAVERRKAGKDLSPEEAAYANLAARAQVVERRVKAAKKSDNGAAADAAIAQLLRAVRENVP